MFLNIDVNKVQVGDRARFYPDNPSESTIKATVEGVAETKTERLEKAYLASYQEGDIQVLGSALQPNLTLKESRFKVILRPEHSKELQHIVRGHVVIFSKQRESVIYRVWVRIWGVLVRESGF